MSDLTTLPSCADTVAGDIEAARRADRRMWLLQQGWTGLVLIALVIGFGLWSSSFLSRLNWINTTSTATEVLLLALGESFVIIAGGIDLSVGAVLGLSGMTGGWVMSELSATTHPDTAAIVAAGFAASIVIGAVCGLANGWLIARHNIPAFVVTLGTMGVATGLADLVYNGQEISSIPAWVGTFGNKDLLGWIPVPVLITAVLCVVCGLALAKTRFGSHTYTIGDNKDAAIRAGLPYRRQLIKIYTLSGLLAGIDGVLVMSRLDAASPTSGTTDNLNAIAAVVIGGASLFGGRGRILGSIIGTLIISVLLTGLIIVNVPPYWQEVAVGVVLIAAVYIDQYSERLRHRD
jgi:ribose transport system permease protein